MNATLSPQERRAVELLCQRKSQKEISAALHISPSTTRTHLQRAMLKLGESTVLGLALAYVAITRHDFDDKTSRVEKRQSKP